METKKVKISELKPMENNPRTIDEFSFKQLKNSIEKYGYLLPLIISKDDNQIIGGNQRYLALKELYGKEKEIEVVVVDLSDEREKYKLNILLNKISGDWNLNKLKNLISEFSFNNEELSFSEDDVFDFNLVDEFKFDFESEDFEETNNFGKLLKCIVCPNCQKEVILNDIKIKRVKRKVD